MGAKKGSHCNLEFELILFQAFHLDNVGFLSYVVTGKKSTKDNRLIVAYAHPGKYMKQTSMCKYIWLPTEKSFALGTSCD